MFPTEIATVLFIIGMLLVSILSNKGMLYILTGFVIFFANFKDTTNGIETLLMACIAIIVMYYGLNVRED